jgi:decaprenylphospho-beta-D-ribofuranose 2-oxidase
MSVSRRDFVLGLAGSALASGCGPSIPPATCTPAQNKGCAGQPGFDSPLTPTCCELWAFDEIHHTNSLVYRPGNEDELAQLLHAVPAGRTLTLRGGGQSLDSQSLNDDLVVILDQPAFRQIGLPQPSDEGYSLTVGAGARWWDVVEAIAPLGFMPPSCVTSGDATVGGTLAADCVSRSSPIYGKEGNQIRRFRLVLSDGTRKECRRNAEDPEEQRLFRAVIGGFGYLGAVTEVTFDLIVARSNPNQWLAAPNVFTRSTRHGPNVDWDVLLRCLHDKSRVERDRYRSDPSACRGKCSAQQRGPLASAPEWSALSIASFLVGSGMSANLLEQRYTESQELRRVPGGIYDKDSNIPAMAERVAAFWPTIAETAVDIGFPQGEYVDELFGWLFFLGNSTRRAKEKSHTAGHRLNFNQQSFALPSGPDDRVDTRPMRRFIELVEARFHAADARPASVDFLHVPADDFVMSASRDFPSFVVTISVADRNCRVLPPKTSDLLCELSRDCRALGGRVHLVKNVVCDGSDLRAMHGDAAAEFKALKSRYDSKRLFQNAFFHRVFEA